MEAIVLAQGIPALGLLVGRARSRKELTQRALGIQLGVSQTAIWQWETGRRLPGIDHLQQLVEVLELDAALVLKEWRRQRNGAVPADASIASTARRQQRAGKQHKAA